MKRPVSLRRTLLIGILAPIGLFVVLNSISLYRQSLAAATLAYDRTLLASAKTIGEQLDVEGYDDAASLLAKVPYSALEAFEADNQSRLFYRVSATDGELVSGYGELPFWRGQLPVKGAYAALVDFYDDAFRGAPVRVAVLLQPVASERGRGMAVVQVAETLELRETLARRILLDTLWRQLLLMAVIAAVVVGVVQGATRPVRRLSAALAARSESDLSPITAQDAPRELLPLIDATNEVMGRLQRLLAHQKRFVRDSAHQLRTPLAVLKAQVQSARRGDLPPLQALAEIDETVQRATLLANQMLSLAKVEQLRQQPESSRLDWAEVARGVALDLAPLIADKALDFEFDAQPTPVRAHHWMLQELTRNLLHNAIKFSPLGGRLHLCLRADAAAGLACLQLDDDGPGIAPALRQRLFAPFSSGDGAGKGAGLGLAICQEIVLALNGQIALHNRSPDSDGCGLTSQVQLPLDNGCQ